MSKASPKTALQGLSPDGLHDRELILNIFSAKVEFNDFGLKLAKSPQTGTQRLKSKGAFKSQIKMLQNSSLDPWAAVVNLVFEFWAQQQFLNKKSRSQLKSPNTEVKPVVPSTEILPQNLHRHDE